MDLRFLRGSAQAPKGHAIFFARSSTNRNNIYCTYCVVPPIQLSLNKYLPSFLVAQMPPEEMNEAANLAGMPIPPMLEEGNLELLEQLAEHRDDDLCELSPINPNDESSRMQFAALACQEYGQMYHTALDKLEKPGQGSKQKINSDPLNSGPLDDLDAEELLLQTMPDRQKLAEISKLIGIARYALEGHDNQSLKSTQQRMQRIASKLPEKYKGQELLNAAIDPSTKGARLAELYLQRSYKMLDEEYAEIPGIEKEIRDVQNS